MEPVGQLWAIVLAAGEGTRLAGLTTALYGKPLPKQFAVLAGERSLLQETLVRIAPLVPAERTLVVVDATQVDHARRQLAPFHGVDLVIQPRNLGTGPGILLPLARLRARDPEARVAILPADHHLANPQPFLSALEQASSPARGRLAPVVLVGAEPTDAESEYGWIVPGRRVPGGAGFRAVRRFIEKPGREVAERLQRRGALWNTFVLVGPVASLWRLCLRHLPAQTRAFSLHAHHVGSWVEGPLLEVIYRHLPSADFSRTVLERSRELVVAAVADSGWSDWGSAARVLSSLDGTNAGAHLRERLVAAGAEAPTSETAHPRRMAPPAPASITRSHPRNHS